MSNLREQLLVVATSYATNRGRSLLRFLGDGNDGAVWESDQQTAIKALERRDSYLRERDAYLRLQDLGIVDIQGFAVPCLIDFDDTKQIVEMTVTAELLGADLAQVESLLDELRCLGIFYFDAKPGNIRFLP